MVQNGDEEIILLWSFLHSFGVSSSVCQCFVLHFASFQLIANRNAMGYWVGGTNECNLQIVKDFVLRDSILHLMNWYVCHTQAHHSTAQHTCALQHAEFHLQCVKAVWLFSVYISFEWEEHMHTKELALGLDTVWKAKQTIEIKW